MWNIRMEWRRSRIPDVIHSGGMTAHSPIRTPLGRSTRHLQLLHPDYSISYSDMLSGWKRQPDTAHAALRWCIRMPCALPWIPKNSPQSCIALVIKKLSKLNTIWLELIARVLNMLIVLKGKHYYSKVFKRVNYKLWNSTFWVVISDIGYKFCWLLLFEDQTQGTPTRHAIRQTLEKQPFLQQDP